MTDENKKDSESPATTSEAYDTMLPLWEKMNSVLGGTRTMRDAGKAYLPRHEEESETAYDERLARSCFYNQTRLTLESMVGRPFSDPMKLIEVPSQAEGWLENIDLQGNSIGVFAREWFMAGVGKGFCHVLVEMPLPRDTEAEEGRARTLEDDRKEGLRPYWVMVPPESVIAAHATVVDGREVVTHLRIKECVVESDGFAEKKIERIKVWGVNPSQVTVYEKLKTDKKKEEWVPIQQYPFDLPYIPFVTYYAHRKGFMLSDPPLLDLADLNIAHWQSNSDQTSILTVSRFPILAAAGVTDSKDIIVGPYVSLATTDPAGRFYYVEHGGAAIEAGRQDLKDTEERMAEYGAMFLRKRPGSITATARALDSAEATSPLQDMTVRFIDAVNNALAITADWVKLESLGQVELSTDFGPEEADGGDLAALGEARRNRDISRETLLREFHRRGVLGDDFDAEQDEMELEEESAAIPTGETDTEIDEGAFA